MAKTNVKNTEPTVVESTEVAVVESTDSALIENVQDLMLQDAGAGLANLTANDFALPFISILQKGSPQVSRANSKYIRGAEQGMIMNTVTLDMYSGETGIEYIPCGYFKSIVEWKHRDTGGGLVAHHSPSSSVLSKTKTNERGQNYDPETGNVFIETAYHCGLLIHPEGGFPEYSVISMYSSQLKKSRAWNTVMRRIMRKDPKTGKVYNPPCYGNIFRLTTKGETKDSYDWFGWNIEILKPVDDVSIFMMARDFSKQIESGNIRLSAPPSDADIDSSDDSHGVPF